VIDRLRSLAPPGLGLPSPLLDEVAHAYASAGRAYHDLSHVLDVADRFAEVGPAWRAPREVYLAVLYHDAIYVPGASENEARSAEMARGAIASFLPGASVDAERVAELILATARHGSLGPADVDADMAYFLDCDMAILGASAPLYDAYARGVAAEYSWLPGERYRIGRGRFLEKILASAHIFLSPSFHARLDAPARGNIARELASRCAPA
jgi:predicted metal-dependent HD superfamily phosphohydrolase